MTKGMKTFAFDPCGFQDFVVSLAKVHRTCKVPAVVAHEGRSFAEVGFLAQILDRLDRGVIERYVVPRDDSFSFCRLKFSGCGHLPVKNAFDCTAKGDAGSLRQRRKSRFLSAW